MKKNKVSIVVPDHIINNKDFFREFIKTNMGNLVAGLYDYEKEKTTDIEKQQGYWDEKIVIQFQIHIIN